MCKDWPMNVDLFDFELDSRHIALRPTYPRDNAKLLSVSPQQISDCNVYNLPNLLRDGDVIVCNDSAVIQAHLLATRAGRSQAKGTQAPPISLNLNLHKIITVKPNLLEWRAFIRPLKRVNVGDILHFQLPVQQAEKKDNPSSHFCAEVYDKQEGTQDNRGDIGLRFSYEASTFYRLLADYGRMPLPPYIERKRPADTQDDSDYQTMFAAHKGSVAAPTAGLHFTAELQARLAHKNINIIPLTLHIGAGTFLPVSSKNIRAHKMHDEHYEISQNSADMINQARAQGRRIIALGTTSLRALESACTNDGKVQAGATSTDIFITPGYDFRIVDGMITNFHLPKSTLFMLVCAFCGTAVMQKAYRHAVQNGYRFYSYGDASLLWRHTNNAT